MKFLIDECLSPELARIAQARGHGESSHVVWMKLGGCGLRWSWRTAGGRLTAPGESGAAGVD